MGGNLFTHAMSAANAEREPVQAHSVGMKPEFE